GKEGLATSIGHSPLTALIDAGAGSRNAIAEALTNILWAPLQDGIQSVSLSANWMWPCKNEGEDARLYQAVQACSDFAIDLGINIPTGKDSLSMKQKYPDKDVLSPGTVIISAAAHCNNVRQVIEPVLKNNGTLIYYINMSGTSLELGGSSFAQVLNKIGQKTPDINQPDQFVKSFNCIQQLIKDGMIYSGHDIGSGGFIISLLEMCFAENNLGASIDVSTISNKDIIHKLFHENVGIIFQASSEVEEVFDKAQIPFVSLGEVNKSGTLSVIDGSEEYSFDIAALRDTWYRTSYLLDQHQSGPQKAKERFENYKHQPLQFQFPTSFNGLKPIIDPTKPRPKAAVIREKGSNSERELANALYTAGFDVKDIHMTDLISGRETLEDVRMIAAVGGFSNSDVLGSAKGWAGAFQYNEKAKKALEQFFARKDTLSLGVCNGCQLFIELGLINPDHIEKPRMDHNQSNKHECTFTSLIIAENPSVMLSSLSGATLGVWASHGEGRFRMPYQEEKYNIVAKYAYADYPACPNGSDFNTAMLCDDTGRHLVMMPHIERSLFQWNWAHYPDGRHDEVSPWIEAFVNARQWIENINISANEG
ncbi:MAG TPA: phosphoribosylformylglycinamidine synthase subunit PurQ, partial [Saprospiraceae bacterium]|nr:phosphoribosylformylglycinamidine synthase subunit PurQ [Saprospiraceae bacterium]